MKKIYFILSNISSGGAERNCVYLKEKMNHSFDTQLVVIHCKHENAVTSNFIGLGGTNLFNSLWKLYRFFKNIESLNIISFSDHATVLLCTLKAINLLKFKLIARPTSIISRRNSVFVRRHALNILYRYFVTKIVFQSNAIRNDFLRLINVSMNKCVVIPNPSYRINDGNENNLKFILPESYLVFVGNLREEKGVLRLLKLYKESSINHALVIVGDGPLMEDSLIYTAKHNLYNVRFVGHVNNPEAFIRNSIALVIPSYFEGYPNVAVEASRLQTPIIGFSDCLVLTEIIDSQNGCLIQPDSTIDFRNAVCSCIQLKKCGLYSSKKINIKHDEKTVLMKYEKIINEL